MMQDFKKKIKLLYYLTFKRKQMVKFADMKGVGDAYFWNYDNINKCTIWYTHLGNGWFHKITEV